MNPRPLLAAAAISLLLRPALAQNAAPEKGTGAAAHAGDTPPPTDSAAAKVAFLKSVAIPVRTIDPKDEDFSDLMPLIEKIGSARVVLLGEQTHGDGATFEGKSRLIKFLHQKMGFDVLAFESGMFDMHWVDEGLKNNAPMSEVHSRGLFGIWALSAQCQDLLNYTLETNRTERPLELAGFDSQFSSDLARQEFPRAAELFFTLADENLIPRDLDTAVTDLSDWIGREQGGAKDPEPKALLTRVQEVIQKLDDKKDILLRVHSPRDVAFMKRCLRNQIAFARQTAAFAAEDMGHGGSIRDVAMGENLAWLVTEYYSGRKIIVWAASMHNMYDAPAAALNGDQSFYRDTLTMGHVAHGVIGDMMYSIMFIADHGKAGMPWTQPWNINKPPANSIDALMHQTDLPLAFLDLKTAAAADAGAWLKEKQVARPLGYAPCDAIWPNQCNAFFFTDEMKPSLRRKEN